MIIHDETFYRQHGGLNFSSAKNLLKSPLHYKASLEAKREPSKNMLFGSIVHAKVLENKDYPVAVMPDGLDGRTKEGKEWKAANAGKETIAQDDWQQCQRMIDAVLGNKDVAYLLSLQGESEIGIVQRYQNVEIKGRIDRLFKDEDGKHAIFDFKTTQSVAPEDFNKSCSAFCYCCQMVWYQNLVALEYGLDSPPAYFWVCVENSDAADVAIYQPSPEHIAIGQKQMEICIEKYVNYVEKGKFPGYGNGIQQLPFSKWEFEKWMNK